MSVRLQPEDLRFDPPTMSSAALAALARDRFGITGSLTPLRGERDLNSLIVTPDGTAYVLRVASTSEHPDTIDFQCAALVHVAEHDPGLSVPRVVPTRDDTLVTSVDVDGRTAQARLLTFLPGITFDDASVVTSSGLQVIGAFQGRLARALTGFHHPAESHFMPWALDSGMLSSDELWSGLTRSTRTAIERHRDRVESASAALVNVRHQVVHNDGHRGNLIRTDTSSEQVTGVIDFGDLARTAVVADLAIQAASFVGHQPDPGDALCALAVGYHSQMPLDRLETEMLVDLVLCRLVLSSLLSDYQIEHTGHIADHVEAELPDLLHTLARWDEVDAAGTTARLFETIAPTPEATLESTEHR